ncbi:MAG: hypothetical protein O3A55_04350 [Bacteroidetes bacterium]|nr:hypothetical protein [Bacteroidota bacterium]
MRANLRKILTSDNNLENDIIIIPEINLKKLLANKKAESLQFKLEYLYKSGFKNVVINLDDLIWDDVKKLIVQTKINVLNKIIIKSKIQNDNQLTSEKQNEMTAHIIDFSDMPINLMSDMVAESLKINYPLIINSSVKKKIEIAISIGATNISVMNDYSNQININLQNSLRLRRNIPNSIFTFCTYGIRTEHQIKQISESGFDSAIIEMDIIEKFIK